METVPAPAQDSAATSPSSVKGEDGNAPQGSGRASPPPNCAICLGTCRNKSFTDSCLHQFCFKCLLTWSKVKAVCPLCKQNFRSIIHNVRSNHQYEEYMVEQRQNEDLNERVDIDALTNASRTFRYRTTLTLPRHESLAIQQLLLQHYPMMANVFPAPPARRRRTASLFRRTVYRHNLWARPLPDFTGRFRDCSPEFYRYNDTQMHRLMPWLNRELIYLLNENEGHITYVMARILELLPQHHINSAEFRDAMQRYFGDRTEHFLHELYCFASTPYDMTGYDRNVQYTTDSRVSTIINEISSSDSDASADSDIVMISSSAPAEPPAGPSRVPAPVYPQNYIPDPSTNNVIPIETISHSDTDDDSEVVVVGYIKPPQDRTPEIVDLLGSDSDVIVQDPPQPETSQASEPESRPVNLVKLSLKWQNREAETDSDDSYVPPSGRHRRRRRHRSGDTGSTGSAASRSTANRSTASSSTVSSSTASSSTASSSTVSSSDSRSSAGSGCTPPPAAARESPHSSDTVTYTPPASPCPPTPSSTSYDGAASAASRDSSEEKRKVSKRKSKRKNSSERSRKRTKRSTSRPHRKESEASPGNSDKVSKRKSHSGKGVKSSKKSTDSTSSSKSYPDRPQASADQPTASTSSNKKHNSDKPPKARRPSNESRRLKSVVQVIKSKKNTSAPYSNGSRSLSSSVQSTSARRPEPAASRTPPLPLPAPKTNSDSQSSDSEDNLPLNLTIKNK